MGSASGVFWFGYNAFHVDGFFLNALGIVNASPPFTAGGFKGAANVLLLEFPEFKICELV